MAADLYRRAFARAAEILGGKAQLANHLKIDLERLSKWSTRAGQPPVQVLQCLADLLKHEVVTNYRRTPGRTKVMARQKSASRRGVRARRGSNHTSRG